MLKRIVCLVLLLTLSSSLLVTAQVTTSSLTGTIKGTANATLAGATVTATHQPTGSTYTAQTTAKGTFNIENMRVGGPYQIKITYVGYQTQTFDDIYLRLAEPFSLNADLTTGEQNLSTVVVTGTTRNSLLSATRNGTTTNIGSRQIALLPTIGRNINELTRLTPQATSTNTGAIGGGNYRQNFITVDGSDFNNTFGIGNNLPAGGSPISIDALGEISINVTPYDVKQSGFIGSAINAVTRNGTNNFSGSAYTFFRSEKQQGNEVAYNTPFVRQNLDIKTYGFRLGGPIIKNKLFFFINAEKGNTTSPGQNNIAATAAQPYGSLSNVSRPTATELDSFSSYLKNRYGYETGGYQNYDNEAENTRFVARIDWNISNRHKFNIRYSQVESKSPFFVSTSRSGAPGQAYAGGAGRTDINALWYKNSNYYQEANFYSLSAELNSSFGKVSNVFRGSYTRQNDPRSSDSEVFPFVDILKDGSPFTSFGYEPFTYGNLRDVKSYSFVDYLTWSAGKNTFTAGLQADFQETKNGFQRFGTGFYTFNSWADFVNGAKARDFTVTYSLLPNYQQAFPKFSFAQYSAYGQDEIAFTKNLRVTVGLRLDLPKYLSTEEIKTHPLVDSLTFAGGEKVNTGILPKTRVLFSPRIGFNWDVKGDRSVQLRGGSGIFTGRVPTVWLVAQSGDAGLIQFTQQFTGTNVPDFSPEPYRPATQPKAGATIPASVSAIDRDFRFPQSWKSSLAVDVKLPGGIVGTLEGIYNKDINVALGRNPNLRDPLPLNAGGYPDHRPIYGATVPTRFINPITTAGLPSATGTSSFNPVVLYNRSQGYYWSATLKLEKQFSRGLSVSLAYVRSEAKNLFDGSGDQLLNTWQNTQIVKNSNDPELSFANYVVPDRLIAAVSYRKEYLKHLATTVSLFFEGSIAGRYSYTYSSDFNRDGQTNDLIYVPRDPSEIAFSAYNYGPISTTGTTSGQPTGTPNVYTAQQQSEIFFRLIESDPYLRSRKGQYAERNGAKLPWRNQVDVKFAQDIFTNIGKKRNSIQFTLDIFNFGNLINKNWGIFKQVNASSILVPLNGNTVPVIIPAGFAGFAIPTNITPAALNANINGTQYPVFRLQTDRGQPVTSILRENNSISSTYYMQFGLRYSFN